MSSSCKGPITVGNQGRTQRPLTLKSKETVLEDLPILEILLTTGLCFALSERQNDFKGWKSFLNQPNVVFWVCDVQNEHPFACDLGKR